MCALRRHAAWLLALLLVACGTPDDPERRLRDAIAAGEQAVEARSLTDAAALVSPDYADERGMDKRAVVQLLLGYLHRHRNIHLLTRIADLTLDQDGRRAHVVLLVAMAGTPIASFDALEGVRADLHRFELQFLDGDEGWQLVRADWRRPSATELLD